jgi:hypothetical protein
MHHRFASAPRLRSGRAEVVGGFLQLIAAAPDQGQHCPLCDQYLRDRRADAGAAAGDQSVVAV